MHIVKTFKNIMRGQTLSRALMNEGFSSVIIGGEVLDVGGARNPDYFNYFQKKDDTHVDIIDGSLQKIDFEKDVLPHEAETYDSVIICNVLEHIFNYQFLIGETHRILKKNGQLIGHVPFFFQYHPDPHDYFRYTKEAVKKILIKAGFVDVDVREVGGGPFLAKFNITTYSSPILFRIVLFPISFALDWIFLRIRPKARERFPFGYIFVAKK